ncbi:hypothetical protein AgCh_021508 [Apium graveolens]
MKQLSGKLGFSSHLAVECVGRSGGIALLWKSSVKCNVLNCSSNFIDAKLSNANGVEWRLTGYYGFPECGRRKESWDLLKWLANYSDLPWVVIGDFNDMINIADKKGNNSHPQVLLDGFKQTIDDCGLIELDLVGGNYTWEKSKGKPEWARERLDRAFASASWWSLFPLCNLRVHHCIHSDHDLIHFEMYSTNHTKKKFRFRFENAWLKENNFYVEVS